MTAAYVKIQRAEAMGDVETLDVLVRDFARFVGHWDKPVHAFYWSVGFLALQARRFDALLELATAYAAARPGDIAAWSPLIRLRRVVGDVAGARAVADQLAAVRVPTPLGQWMRSREVWRLLGDLPGEMRGLAACYSVEEMPPQIGPAQRESAERVRQFAQFAPLWRGEPLEGKQLLLIGDNGIGDQIQLFRFLPAVVARSRGARVVLVCHPSLVDLARVAGWSGEIIAQGSPELVRLLQPPRFDYHITTDLCAALDGTTLATLPPAPYLRLDRGAEPAILSGLPRPRVGLVWAGDPTHPTDHLRSLPLPMVERLVASTRDVVSWVSCQVGPSQEWLRSSEILRGLPDVGATVRDMSDTARAFLHLDLVVSVDSSPAHLAGALGVPVWTLLGALADTRWLLEGEATPWYGSMRLIRDGEQGDWAPAIERVSGDLRRWAEDRSVRSRRRHTEVRGAKRPRARRGRS